VIDELAERDTGLFGEFTGVVLATAKSSAETGDVASESARFSSARKPPAGFWRPLEPAVACNPEWRETFTVPGKCKCRAIQRTIRGFCRKSYLLWDVMITRMLPIYEETKKRSSWKSASLTHFL
jgi:hypothetical protein